MERGHLQKAERIFIFSALSVEKCVQKTTPEARTQIAAQRLAEGPEFSAECLADLAADCSGDCRTDLLRCFSRRGICLGFLSGSSRLCLFFFFSGERVCLFSLLRLQLCLSLLFEFDFPSQEEFIRRIRIFGDRIL